MTRRNCYYTLADLRARDERWLHLCRLFGIDPAQIEPGESADDEEWQRRHEEREELNAMSDISRRNEGRYF